LVVRLRSQPLEKTALDVEISVGVKDGRQKMIKQQVTLSPLEV
jgi:hypothetical protein